MSNGPPGRDPKANNGPDFVKSDGARRVSTWMNETERGLRPSSEIDKSYPGKDGEWQRTNRLSLADLLPTARLLEQTYDEARAYQRDYNRTKDGAEHTRIGRPVSYGPKATKNSSCRITK